jgi:hypothetical protein
MKVVALKKTTMTVAGLAKEGPVVLTRAGHPVVAVRDLSGSDWESVSLASRAETGTQLESRSRTKDAARIKN